MYKIIGDDKKEYGPVSAEQLRQWIAQGRVNASTLVQAEGSTEWKPLSTFPELAAFLSSTPTIPPPLTGDKDGKKLTEEILARDYDLDIGSCLSRAWTLMKSDFWPIIGISALNLIILVAACSMYVGIVVSGPLIGGLLYYYARKIRGERAELEDSFAGFKQVFLQLFAGYLISQVLIAIGFVFCILPGIYLMIAWQFTLPLIIDRRIDFWPAMEVSRKVVSKHWWTLLWFTIVLVLLNIVGALACGVGLFISFPLTMIAFMYAYEDIFRAPITPPAQPV